jgi:lysozyme family protein
MSFESTLPHVLAMEGGYADVKGDAGGETFRGVSRVANPKWPGWPLIDAAKAEGHLTARSIDRCFENDPEMERHVADLYREKYYAPLAKWLPEGRVLDKVFDTGINTGNGKAALILQRALASAGRPVAQDGVLGPMTAKAVKTTPEDTLLRTYVAAQEGFYKDIARSSPGKGKFLKGWLRRAAWVPPRAAP